MGNTEQLQEKTTKWLKGRGISPQVISAWGISVEDDGTIVIPVHDSGGSPLFNKYRRSPFKDGGPKYWYEKSADAALYGIHTLTSGVNDHVIICEGELDALRLASEGITAVTSTGGASTFNEEWLDPYEIKDIYICLDYDEPGIKGAYKIHDKIPGSRIIWLPEEGMDVTDYFQKGFTVEGFRRMMVDPHAYHIPSPVEEVPNTKKELKQIIRDQKNGANYYLDRKRDAQNNNRNYKHLEVLLKMYRNVIKKDERKLRYMGREVTGDGKEFDIDKEDAKKVPIDEFVEFNRANMRKCLWHQDDTPSMKYYPDDNRVYCFGCDKSADVIDVVQERFNVDFKKALKIIAKSA